MAWRRPARTTWSRSSCSRSSWSRCSRAALAALFSSPDEKPITSRHWAPRRPATSSPPRPASSPAPRRARRYGPPYNTHRRRPEVIGPIAPQKWAGVQHPVDSAQDFVLDPLARLPGNPRCTALARDRRAPTDQQRRWAAAYSDALGKARTATPARSPPGDYGPVAGHDRRAARHGRSGGSRQRPPVVGHVLPDGLHHAAALPRRRGPIRGRRPAPSTCTATSGG